MWSMVLFLVHAFSFLMSFSNGRGFLSYTWSGSGVLIHLVLYAIPNSNLNENPRVF